MSLMGFKRLVLLAGIVVISGCVAVTLKQESLSQLLATSHNPSGILAQLKNTKVSKKDRVQYLLNLGYLQLITGDFDQSIKHLTEAKEAMAALEAFSINEGVQSLTMSEINSAYQGTPTDRVLVHGMLALSYLFKQDLSGARVEVLQADVTMQKLVKKRDLSGQLAFVHYLSGLIYELNHEVDNALISYRRAYHILKEKKVDVPPSLKRDLLRLTEVMNLTDEYEQFLASFGEQFRIAEPISEHHIYLYFKGVVTGKTTDRLSVLLPDKDVFATVAMPYYPPYRAEFVKAPTQLNDYGLSVHTVENIEQIVRSDFESERAKILALATTRAALKYNMVRKMQEKNEFAGLLMNVATVATEQADTRSWNMLPSAIQIGRKYLPHEVAQDNDNIKINPSVKKPSYTLYFTTSHGKNRFTAQF